MHRARILAAGVVLVVAPVTGAEPAGAAGTLVALWKMNETSGTVMRDSIASHHGSLHSVQLGLPGFKGTAYGFTGSSYVSVPSSSRLNPGNQNITIAIHLKTTRVPPSGGDWDLIRKGYYETQGGEFKVEYQPSGRASCGFKGSAGYSELIAGPALNNDQWHTVRCVKTASTIQLYVDGQTFSKNAAIGSFANSEPVVIGSRPGAEYFRGSLDHASIRIG
jgi:hypothetical protein